jgi:hypothetical protein
MAAYQATATGGVIRASDRAYVPNDPKNADWQIYQAWLARGNTTDPAPAPPRVRSLSAFALRQRFSLQERAAITVKAAQLAAGGDPSLQMAMDDLGSLSQVNLDDPRVAAALDLLVSQGCITADRKPALLADPTQDELASP